MPLSSYPILPSLHAVKLSVSFDPEMGLKKAKSEVVDKILKNMHTVLVEHKKASFDEFLRRVHKIHDEFLRLMHTTFKQKF